MVEPLPQWTALAPAIVLGLTGLLLLTIDLLEPEDSRPTLLAGTAVLGTLGALGFAGWFLAAGTGQVRRTAPSSCTVTRWSSTAWRCSSRRCLRA